MRETSEVAAAARRMIGAVGLRVAGEDPQDLTLLVGLRAHVDLALQCAVDGQRAKGVTDVAIGEALGMTRQAVQQRWPRPPGSPTGGGARYVRR